MGAPLALYAGGRHVEIVPSEGIVTLAAALAAAIPGAGAECWDCGARPDEFAIVTIAGAEVWLCDPCADNRSGARRCELCGTPDPAGLTAVTVDGAELSVCDLCHQRRDR